MKAPINGDVAAAFGRFFHGGSGPSHSTLTQIFRASGYQDADTYDAGLGTPNKQNRVVTVFREAERRPATARRLVDDLLVALRSDGCFTRPGPEVASLARALSRIGWQLDPDGYLEPIGHIDLETGGREALDEQLKRILRNTEDPAVLLGVSKDLLESICKFVLEERACLPERRIDFPEALHLALDRLALLPTSVSVDSPGGKQVREIYQSAKRIAESVNELRNLEGTGHGRTLPTGVSPETARYVIRQTSYLAELMLAVHDREVASVWPSPVSGGGWWPIGGGCLRWCR